MMNRSSIIGIFILCGFLLFLSAPYLYGGDNPDGQKVVKSGGDTAMAVKDGVKDQSAVQHGFPSIDIPEESYDCGRIPQDSECSHIYKIRNTGTAPLKLIRAKAS